MPNKTLTFGSASNPVDITVNGELSIGISADNITSGILGVARGGTGVASTDLIKATYGVEYIVGTQTASTNVWTGITASPSLYTGKTIAYYLPYAGTSSAATLNLTLSGGGTTGAKNVRINNSNVTTHFAQYSVIVLVYDGTYWKVDNYDANTPALRVYRQTTGYNANYPLLVSRTAAASIGTADTNDSYTNVYGVMWNDTTKVPTLNPSTGTLTATNFAGTINGYSIAKSVPSNAVFTDTHNTAYLYAGASNGSANASTTNGNTYLIAKDGSSVSSRVKLGSGKGISVTSDASGNVTIQHTHTDITAGTVGTSSATSGASLAVPYVTYDAQGHITSTGTHTHTITGFLTSHQDISGKANLASPAFSGTPTAPTAATGTNNTQIATTAFVQNATNGLGWILVAAVDSPGQTAVSIPIASLVGKAFLKIVIYNSGSSNRSESLAVGFSTTAAGAVTGNNFTFVLPGSSAFTYPYFISISSVAGTGENTVWYPQKGSSSVLTFVGSTNQPFLNFRLTTTNASFASRIEIYAM